MGLEPKLNIGKTGLIADLKFGDGPMIALRADMDALPIQETSGLSFSSKNEGVMHACGHDGHMAMLLATAKALTLNRKQYKNGSIRFVFQPAEEGLGGAKFMIEDGAIDNVDEMKTIRYMKTLRSKGWSYFRISDKLNEKNIIGKSGGKWYGMSVRNVLSYY